MASPQGDTGALSFREAIPALVTLLGQRKLVTYVNLAATIFYVWNIILTMDDEITYIWGSSMSMVKVFYFLDRYLRLVLVIGNTLLVAWPTPSTEMCLALAIGGLGTGIVLNFLIGVILQIRLYALYNHNTKLIVCVALLFTVQTISMVTLVALQDVIAARAQEVGHILGAPYCSTPLSPAYFAVTIPSLLFGSIVLVLACYNSIQRYRLFPPTSSQAAQNGRHLVVVLLRDSVWYFSVYFAVTLADVMTSRYGPPVFIAVTSALYAVAIGAGASKMLVNTRKAVRRPEHYPYSTSKVVYHS